jgi:solute carrier family 35 protein E1|uniref:Sugar phosphate transporter domain-containing protein n=1 Tax=Eutreptiella gymnastica TaxID=73025 RepID=A0A7S4GBQ8_9EUGL
MMQQNLAMEAPTQGRPVVYAMFGVSVAVFVLLATLATYPDATLTSELFVAPALGVKSVMPNYPAQQVGSRMVRTTAGQIAEVPAAIATESTQLQAQDLERPIEAGLNDIPETASKSSSTGPAIFNALSTIFFGIVFYIRRKVQGKEYTPIEQQPLALATSSGEASTEKSGGLWKTITSIDYSLVACLTFWYLGNYYYNITNKLALNATGGAAGCPLTIASLQLLVGVVYGLFLWVAPDARKFPSIKMKDVIAMVPLAIAFAGAHFSTVFAMSAGAVSFGQIVKASEPAFAALLGTVMYNKSISKAKWLSLIPVIGGVCLASAAELNFSVAALIAGIVANLFAALKANENKKAMDAPGLKDRLGTVGNQFAVTMLLSWAISAPFVLLKEWNQLPMLVEAWTTNPIVSFNIIAAGLWFYLYNELATFVVKKTGPVTQSVANTAKRVIVIVACAIVLGESLTPLKLIGCTIGIAGVFLYSIIDDFIKPKPKEVTGSV